MSTDDDDVETEIQDDDEPETETESGDEVEPETESYDESDDDEPEADATPEAEDYDDTEAELETDAYDDTDTEDYDESEASDDEPAEIEPEPETYDEPQPQVAATDEPPVVSDYWDRWTTVQAGFVDAPAQAVQQADRLLTEALDELWQKVADERAGLAARWRNNPDVSTDDLRLVFQDYRALFINVTSGPTPDPNETA